jgi:hypothetical protein
VRLTLRGEQARAPGTGDRRQERRLAAGAGTQVEPQLVGPLEVSSGDRQRDQLGTLVLDSGATLPDRGHVRRVTALQHDSVGRPAGRRPGQLGPRRPARTSHQDDPRRDVVGGEQLLELVAAHRALELLDHPPWVGVDERQAIEPVGSVDGCEPAYPSARVVLGDLAQHGVGQAGRPLADPGPDQVDGGADGRVRRHAHGEQLVGPQPQGVTHLRLQPRPGQARVDHRVVEPLLADRAGGQLGREGRVTTCEPVLAQDPWQDQVGEGTVDADRLQHVVGRQPRRIGSSTPAVSHRPGVRGRGAPVPGRPRRR